MLNGEARLQCDVRVHEMQLEHMSEFKYLGYVLNPVEMRQCDVGRWRVGGKLQVLLGP